jgi:hypothetical protein
MTHAELCLQAGPQKDEWVVGEGLRRGGWRCAGGQASVCGYATRRLCLDLGLGITGLAGPHTEPCASPTVRSRGAHTRLCVGVGRGRGSALRGRRAVGLARHVRSRAGSGTLRGVPDCSDTSNRPSNRPLRRTRAPRHRAHSRARGRAASAPHPTFPPAPAVPPHAPGIQFQTGCAAEPAGAPPCSHARTAVRNTDVQRRRRPIRLQQLAADPCRAGRATPQMMPSQDKSILQGRGRTRTGQQPLSPNTIHKAPPALPRTQCRVSLCRAPTAFSSRATRLQLLPATATAWQARAGSPARRSFRGPLLRQLTRVASWRRGPCRLGCSGRRAAASRGRAGAAQGRLTSHRAGAALTAAATAGATAGAGRSPAAQPHSTVQEGTPRPRPQPASIPNSRNSPRTRCWCWVMLGRL